MYRSSRFAKRTEDLGKPLPDTFQQFKLPWHVTFRHGQVAMLAGAPGTMKSIFALNLATIWAQYGLWGMYFSGDSDEPTVATRLSAMLTALPLIRVEKDLLGNNSDRYTQALHIVDSVLFVYDDLRMKGIEEYVAAFESVSGAYPDFVVIDNVKNYIENGSDWQQADDLVSHLNVLARKTRSHVLALHHTSESEAIERPPPRRAIQGKITSLPTTVLTAGAEGMSLFIACVKNRSGKQDPEARSWLYFSVNQALQVSETRYGNVMS